jgi:hypothetical protein
VDRLRGALDLYRRENGRYPKSLDLLVNDDWVGSEQISIRGYKLGYALERGGDNYRITLDRDR